MRKGYLHHSKIRDINRALILIVKELGTTTVGGEYLIALYEKIYGIGHHGYNENSFYDIHIRDNFALITENHNVPTPNSKSL